MYESADQKEPTYEAKGIETVRRDGCPAVAKVNLKTRKKIEFRHSFESISLLTDARENA